MFNNIWGIIIVLILIYAIYKQIIKLNKPFDKCKFISQNQSHIKDQNQLNNLIKIIPQLTSYYVGVH